MTIYLTSYRELANGDWVRYLAGGENYAASTTVRRYGVLWEAAWDGERYKTREEAMAQADTTILRYNYAILPEKLELLL